MEGRQRQLVDEMAFLLHTGTWQTRIGQSLMRVLVFLHQHRENQAEPDRFSTLLRMSSSRSFKIWENKRCLSGRLNTTFSAAKASS